MPLPKAFSGGTWLHALTYSHARHPPHGLDHGHQHLPALPRQHKGQLRAQALHHNAPQLCLPSTAPPALSALPNTPTCTSHHQHNTMTNKPAYWWKECLATVLSHSPLFFSRFSATRQGGRGQQLTYNARAHTGLRNGMGGPQLQMTEGKHHFLWTEHHSLHRAPLHRLHSHQKRRNQVMFRPTGRRCCPLELPTPAMINKGLWHKHISRPFINTVTALWF